MLRALIGNDKVEKYILPGGDLSLEGRLKYHELDCKRREEKRK